MENKLRNGQSVDSVIYTLTTFAIEELLSFQNAKESAAGPYAIGLLTRLVKEGKPINDAASIELLKSEALLNADGTLNNDVRAIVDAMFEGSGIEAQIVNPFIRE